MHKVSEKLTDYALSDSTRHVRLFRNGTNQAVRIPREFELDTQEATMRKVGNTLVIEPVKPSFPKGSREAVLQMLDELRKLGPTDDEFPDVDEGLLPLDDIIL